MAKGFQKSSESSNWASMVELFEMLGGFERMCSLMSFWIGKKVGQQIQNISDVDRQFENMWLVWSGSAGEAACWARERVVFV